VVAASLTFIVLTAADVSGIRITDPGFGWLLVTFVGQIDLGRALGVSALLILVVFTFAVTATQVTTAAWECGAVAGGGAADCAWWPLRRRQQSHERR
jgi:hypothetical protein